jgi:thioredoxin reductase (NADPH)
LTWPWSGAGLAASVYGTSEGLATAVIDGIEVGGQIGTTSRIENYLGFPVGVSGEDLTASMSQYLTDRIARHPAITIMSRCAVREVDGDRRLERVTIEDLTTSTRRKIAAAALFVLIGAEAHTQWLAESIELDNHGFIVTGPDLSGPLREAPAWEKLGRDLYLLETSLPGVFAAGDVRSSSVKRVASAVGEGSIAIRFATEHLARSAGLAATGTAARS